MEPQTKSKTSAKDFFINLGTIVALGTVVTNLINLLFTVINKAYPQILNGYYSSTYSISFPVASLIIFFPIYILLMWLLEREYIKEPGKRHIGVRKWLTYITLFLAGLAIAGDLVTVLYYFIDGQELTPGFILKVAGVLIIALALFMYYIFDMLDKHTSLSRKTWLIVSTIIILSSIIWGFSVLGSPRTQQLLKYDEQKVNDLMNIKNNVDSYYSQNKVLPTAINDMLNENNNYYFSSTTDLQTQKLYEYKKTGDKTYELCAEFNKDSQLVSEDRYSETAYPYGNWRHPVGHYCFTQTISPNLYNQDTAYPKLVPMR